MPPARDSLAVSAPPGQFQPGAVVGSRFRLDALLSQDSVSQTYRATDANRRGPAAVRIISLRTLGPAAAQLVTDVENASALVHKNLVEVLTAGREADYFFIATELLDGQTLREFIDNKRREGRNVSFKGACNLITHVANGLERAAGLMPHGGLNPAAIWVNKAGRVKVADLGLARTIPALARRGAPSGAPDHVYCAPEVLAGAAADLGLRRLLAGDHALRGGHRPPPGDAVHAGHPGRRRRPPHRRLHPGRGVLPAAGRRASPRRWSCATRSPRPWPAARARRAPRRPRPRRRAPRGRRPAGGRAPGGAAAAQLARALVQRRRGGGRRDRRGAGALAHPEGQARLRAVLAGADPRPDLARRDPRRAHDRRQRHRRAPEGEGLPGR